MSVDRGLRIGDVPVFDASHYLDTPDACAEYLTAVMEDGTDEEIRRALGVIARAAGVRDHTLVGDVSSPTIAGDRPSEFAAVVRMMKSWGITISATAMTPAA